VFQIEVVNWSARECYLTAQDELRARLSLISRPSTPARQSWWVALASSWGSTWPAVWAIGLTIVGVSFLSSVR
jgi:hypothetical protein